jgi:hypothetical protein
MKVPLHSGLRRRPALHQPARRGLDHVSGLTPSTQGAVGVRARFVCVGSGAAGCENRRIAEHYLRPDWFTEHVFNRVIAALTRLGVSVAGSRVLEVRGRKTARLPRPALGDRELAEARDRHLPAGGQLALDRLERRLDRPGRITAAKPSAIRNLVDQLALVHSTTSKLDAEQRPTA